MARWREWLRGVVAGGSGKGLGRGARAGLNPSPRPPVGTFKIASQAEGGSLIARAAGDFLPLPNDTPFHMLQVYRFLRDAIPDVSDAVWTWKRLCQTGYDVSFTETSSDAAAQRARRVIAALDARVNSGDRGMDGLLDILYTSLFTYGACAVEIVLSQSRESIWDVVPVDVWTVRFKRENGVLQPYQLQNGRAIRLPRERFVYIGMDRDGTNPYGRSILRSIPFVIKIQQRLLEDMAKATHNAGWSKLHVQYAPEPRQPLETEEAYRGRMAANLEHLRARLSGLETDQNLVTYDNVKIGIVRGEQQAQVFYDNHKAVEEQVITGTHLMPILLGRNYGTTETYGTAQFEIINRQVDSLNKSIRALLERLYNFELALMWGEARAAVSMRANRTVDVLKEAQARGREIENALRLQEAGLIDKAAAARTLGV